MLFSSPEFMFGYLPVVFAVFLVLLRHTRGDLAILFLAISSLFFYGWWDVRYVPLLLASIAFNYGIGLAIRNATSGRKGLLIVGVTGDLLLLAGYKYTGFVIASINSLFDLGLPVPHIELPLGISFYTFTQIAFLADAYWRKAHETDPIKYGLFVTYFPHLIAGPVIHHKEMMSQFTRDLARQSFLENVSVGLTMFIFGLFKKVVIADSLSPIVGSVFGTAAGGGSLTFWEAWLGALAYTLQLYFDFSGYSEMALGLSRMFGIRLPANFNSPYQAHNIIEFWRRWHMTLSRFLRDYLYFSLGGNRKGKVRRYVNLLITMVLGGLWHGAGWTFVIWGTLHGLYLCINHAWRTVVGDGPDHLGLFRRFGPQLLTFLAVVVGWVFFRAADVNSALSVLHAMVGGNGISLPMQLAASLADTGLPFGVIWPNIPPELEPNALLPWVLMLILVAWFAPSVMQIMKHSDVSLSAGEYADSQLRWQPNLWWTLVVAGMLTLSIVQIFEADSSEFLYFQF